MDSFRTEFPVLPAPFTIDHDSPVLSMGSCFAENIGKKLRQRKFQVALNPFGILYNPVSLAGNLLRLINQKPYEAGELFFRDGCWHSFDHHGQFSHPDQQQTLLQINTRLAEAGRFLSQTKIVLLTLGTAKVFEYKEKGKVVANCHKVPAENFRVYRLGIDEVASLLEEAILALQRTHPEIRILLTVSPVRHLRDGLVENQRSKSVLLLAVEALCKKWDFAHYFPAYELLLDDLRDYRFYEADLTHPNATAVDYIWKYFSKTYFSEPTKHLNTRIEKIITASQHRPFHPELAQHQTFLRQQFLLIEELEQQFPSLDFSQERITFSEGLS